MTTGTAPAATQPALLSAPRRAAALAVLTACVFVVGTAEWVMVGPLPQLSADLHRPLPAVGSLVTWYALVVTVAGPLVTVGMLHLARRHALLILLGMFVAGNLAAVTVPTLVISTMLDHLVTPHHHRQLAEAIRGAHYAEITTGHLPFIEQPEQWGALIRDVLARARH